MIYRKAPLQPVRLLLRVVGVAGVGAVAGALACSSSGITSEPVGGGIHGAVDAAPAEGSASSSGGGIMGFADSGVMGVTDGGGDELVTGVLPNPDGGFPCDGACGAVDGSPDVVTGVVVNPDGGVDE